MFDRLPGYAGGAVTLIIRHARSMANGHNRAEYGRIYDAAMPLALQGKEQAKELGGWLAKRWASAIAQRPGWRLKVLLSPYARAVATWDEARKAHSTMQNAETQYDWRLREQDGGESIALSKVQLRAQFHQFVLAEAAGYSRTLWRPRDGESGLDVMERIKPVVKDLRAAHDHAVVRLVVTHGITSLCLRGAWLKVFEEEPYWLDQTSTPRNCEVWALYVDSQGRHRAEQIYPPP